MGIKNWFERNSSWTVDYEAGSMAETEYIIEEIKADMTRQNAKSECYVAIVDLSFKTENENSCTLGFDIIKKKSRNRFQKLNASFFLITKTQA